MQPSDEQIDKLLYYMQERLDEDIVSNRDKLREGVRQWCEEVSKPPCPVDWAAVEEMWKWCTVDADGMIALAINEPVNDAYPRSWGFTGTYIYPDSVDMVGVDWRLCKWRRPEEEGE